MNSRSSVLETNALLLDQPPSFPFLQFFISAITAFFDFLEKKVSKNGKKLIFTGFLLDVQH